MRTRPFSPPATRTLMVGPSKLLGKRFHPPHSSDFIQHLVPSPLFPAKSLSQPAEPVDTSIQDLPSPAATCARMVGCAPYMPVPASQSVPLRTASMNSGVKARISLYLRSFPLSPWSGTKSQLFMFKAIPWTLIAAYTFPQPRVASCWPPGKVGIPCILNSRRF